MITKRPNMSRFWYFPWNRNIPQEYNYRPPNLQGLYFCILQYMTSWQLYQCLMILTTVHPVVVVVVVVVVAVAVAVVVVVVVLFPTEYKHWLTDYMSNIITSKKLDIDDSVGGHKRSQRLIRLATNVGSTQSSYRKLCPQYIQTLCEFNSINEIKLQHREPAMRKVHPCEFSVNK